MEVKNATCGKGSNTSGEHSHTTEGKTRLQANLPRRGRGRQRWSPTSFPRARGSLSKTERCVGRTSHATVKVGLPLTNGQKRDK